jgi:polysaccharide biosynthesis protein PslH
VPALQRALDGVLRGRRFDIVNLEFPYLGHLDLRQAPPSKKVPALVVDSHELAYDLGRQFAGAGGSLGRRLYAADVEYYQPRPTDPPPDGRTVVYFGLLSTVPNVDGVIHFVQNIWPGVAAAHPDARCKIIGGRPPPSLLTLGGTRVELTGFVSDLRPHLAAAAAVVVPLRLGGGTRLKIVEAMAMEKAIISTTLGVEGIEVVPGRDLLIEDEPAAFADAVSRLLADPDLAALIGQSARQLALRRYSWSEAAQALEGFYCRILEVGP